MVFKFLNDKINVFISSKCGKENEDYEIIRNGLKNLLEETGFIRTYVFEETNASSMNIQEEYLNRLEDSDIILFLIDNKEYNCSEGVLKEWEHSKNLEKKSICLFYNYDQKDLTSIQKELKKPNSIKWMEVSNKKDFLEKGYKSIVEDIIRIYREYCKNRIYISDSQKLNNNQIEQDDNLLDTIQKWELEKNIFLKFPTIKDYFKSKNATDKFENLEISSDIEKGCLYFIKLLLCEEDYNKEYIEVFIESICELHHDINKDIIVKKWESINYCYNNNISKAITCLNEAYDSGLENNVDKWILNDILIDKRNLEALNNTIENAYIFETESQKILNENQDILFYPFLDRLSKEIYNNILKEINNVNMDGPYTNRMGTGLDRLLEQVSEYYIIAVYYGSYTHIKIIIKLLQDIFYNFYNIYEYNVYGFEALKYSILYSDSKIIENICDRHSNIISTCSMKKINNLYSLSHRKDLKYESEKLKLTAFKYLGYYFDEDFYTKIEFEIFNIFNEWLYSQNPSINFGNLVFDTIKNNIYRMDICKIADFLILVIEKKYYRFFDNVFEIFSLISYNNINKSKFKKIVDIIAETIVKISEGGNVNINKNYLEKSVIVLRKADFEYSYILDKIIEKHWKDFYDVYKLEIFNKQEDCYIQILKYVEEIKSRNLNQKGGCYIGYAYNPQDLIKYIIKDCNIDLKHNNLLNLLTGVCAECLMNEKQSIKEKISTLQLLTYLKYNCTKNMVDFNWKEYNDLLEDDIVRKGYSDYLFNKESELTLMINYILYKIINEKSDKIELLDLLGYYNDYNTYENIKALDAINNFIENSELEHNIKEIYIMLIQFISRYRNDKNYEVRCRVIDCFFGLINKLDMEVILNYINRMSNDQDYRVKLFILNNIKNQEKKSILIYRDILEKYNIDNHYLVKNKSKKLLEMNQLD